MISLFEHNERAYDSAIEMLLEINRAAVIHPTGTGKSFIGFKLAEDNPDKVICWLSPSEYIYRTQLENLKRCSDGFVPENIQFFTYAKLIVMSDDEIKDIHPDFIILDEFHRCGAEVWGGSVRKLLDFFDDVPVLGLSATNIRYLDNQRDMAEELFDGHIASEMTLGEAITLGILAAPVYISAVYCYQTELEKYRKKIKSARFAPVRDKAERCLEELRRTLENSEGLDVIFDKNMTERNGKYIVFCANADHMDEMISHVPEWFGRVDKNPEIYKVYSESSESEKEFERFQNSKSDRLKLLFCIDMLNEGVHLEDVSGVILFRPTVSPTIYKQQIGRALTAGEKRTPVIFDIINNFENLYSMGSIEQEMAAAITYYNYIGESDKVVTDRFEIVGEIRNCLELFNKLNEILTASWDEMYSHAKDYYCEHGNLEVNKSCKTENGLSLGSWIVTQRRVRRGDSYGLLDERRIRLLDEIGMRWDYVTDINWEKNFSAAKDYYNKNGDLCAPVQYIDENGVSLGSWLSNLRTYRKSGIHKNYLTEERISELDKIGMVWNVPDYLWEKNFSAAMEFYRENGHLDVPAEYISTGIKLGLWIRNLRSGQNKLTDSQRERLNEIGMLWKNKFVRNWDIGFSHAQKYFKANGNLNVPGSYICEDGFKLGSWIANHREKAGTRITPERKVKLDSIGMIWTKPDSWEVRFALVKKYHDEFGNIDIPANYVSDGIWISKWLDEQRQIYRGKRKGKSLTHEQVKRLEALGFKWINKTEQLWFDYFEELKKYVSTHGNADMSSRTLSDNGIQLGRWILSQKKYYSEGKLNPEYADMLRSVGVKFDEKLPKAFIRKSPENELQTVSQ